MQDRNFEVIKKEGDKESLFILEEDKDEPTKYYTADSITPIKNLSLLMFCGENEEGFYSKNLYIVSQNGNKKLMAVVQKLYAEPYVRDNFIVAEEGHRITQIEDITGEIQNILKTPSELFNFYFKIESQKIDGNARKYKVIAISQLPLRVVSISQNWEYFQDFIIHDATKQLIDMYFQKEYENYYKLKCCV